MYYRMNTEIRLRRNRHKPMANRYTGQFIMSIRCLIQSQIRQTQWGRVYLRSRTGEWVR